MNKTSTVFRQMVVPFPPGQSQPMEFKAWNFSLKFRTLPCWFGSAMSRGSSSFGPHSWKSWPCHSMAVDSSDAKTGPDGGSFSMMITLRLLSKVTWAVTYKASSLPGSCRGEFSDPLVFFRPLLVLRLQQRPILADLGGSIMFSGTERLRLTGGARDRLPSPMAASSWEAYLEQSSRTSGQLKVSVSKGLREFRVEARVPGEVVLGLVAEGLKEKCCGDVSPAEQDFGELCSGAISGSEWKRDSTGFLLPLPPESCPVSSCRWGLARFFRSVSEAAFSHCSGGLAGTDLLLIRRLYWRASW